jgi:arsenite methyltransferase
MALTCPTGFDIKSMRTAVRSTYENVARAPDETYHFHRGLDYAVEYLGYERALLEELPAQATASFAGVGNPHRIGPLRKNAIVLDIGAGAGLDLLLAARRVGPRGRAIAVDMTPAMRTLARENAARAGLSERVDIRPGLAEDLPLGKDSVDFVLTNGVLNLTSDKVRAFSEIRRVLKPGGRLHMADVLLQVDLNEHERMDAHLWAA